MNGWKGKRVFGDMYWLCRGHFIVYVPTQALTTMCSVWKWWFTKKTQKSFAEIQKDATPTPEKTGSSSCLLTFAAVVYNRILVFCRESNLSVFLVFSVFLMATQLSFLSSARKRTWPMPAFCHQARARPSLSAVVLRSGETHLVSSIVQEQQVASCVQPFHRVEKKWRPLSRCRHATQGEHIWLWPRAMILLHCCVPASPVTECPMYANARTTTVRETYNTMKSDICFISLTQHKHPALILPQENATSIYFFQAYCA